MQRIEEKMRNVVQKIYRGTKGLWRMKPAVKSSSVKVTRKVSTPSGSTSVKTITKSASTASAPKKKDATTPATTVKKKVSESGEKKPTLTKAKSEGKITASVNLVASPSVKPVKKKVVKKVVAKKVDDVEKPPPLPASPIITHKKSPSIDSNGSLPPLPPSIRETLAVPVMNGSPVGSKHVSRKSSTDILPSPISLADIANFFRGWEQNMASRKATSSNWEEEIVAIANQMQDITTEVQRCIKSLNNTMAESDTRTPTFMAARDRIDKLNNSPTPSRVATPPPPPPFLPLPATQSSRPPSLKLDLSPLNFAALENSEKVPMSPHPLSAGELTARQSLLSDILKTPRDTVLKPVSFLQKNARRRMVSADGVEIKPLDPSGLASKLNFNLTNRPTREDLTAKNIMKEADQLAKQKWTESVEAERNKLKKALLKRPSVMELAEKSIIQEISGSQGNATGTLHQETLSYTKSVKSHLYGVALFVLNSMIWSGAGDSIRVYDPQGKILKMVKIEKKTVVKSMIPVKTGSALQVWAGAADNNIYIFDCSTYEFVKTLTAHHASVKTMLQVENGTVWSASTDGCVSIWDPTTYTRLKQIQCHTRAINALCCVAGRTWSASDDQTIRVTDSTDLKFVKKLRGHMSYVTCLAAVGSRVWSGSADRSVGVWDVKTLKFAKRLPHDKAVRSIVGLPKIDQVLTGSADGSVRVYDNKNFTLLRILDRHNYGVNCLVTEGNMVWCTYIDQIVAVWDAVKMKEVQRFKLSESVTLDFTYEQAAEVEEYDDDFEEGFPALEYINLKLKDDADVAHHLPMTNSKKTATAALKDGTVLCKLVRQEVGLIDPRVMNLKKNLTNEEATANIHLVLNAAAMLGIDVSGITPTDFLQERSDVVLGLTWQIVEGCIFGNISNLLKNDPRYHVLAQKHEDVSQLPQLPPEEILLRWFNHHLKNSGCGLTVTNFSSDIENAEAYLHLMRQLNPNVDVSEGMAETDLAKRAEFMLKSAREVGCGNSMTPQLITEGRHLANMAFVAELFKKCPFPVPVTNETDSETNPDASKEGIITKSNNVNINTSEGSSYFSSSELGLLSSDREIRSFLSWIRSFQVDPFVSDLFEDLQDGLVLLRILNKISPGIVDFKKVNLNPDNTFKRTENCNTVVSVCHKLGLPLPGICGKDIEQGHQQLTRALLSQLMRYDLLNFLKNIKFDGNDITEPMMIEWANKKVATVGNSRRIESFRDSSLKTSHFLLDLLSAIKKDSVNYQMVEPGDNIKECMMNAEYVINSAWKIGCSVSILWEDIVEVKGHMILVFVAALMIYAQE
eukprot:TRINITY_DN2274_c0_g1_i1.p1 TRINITY_DN2274_c0_g1~~TRINITY_DN2274_c0_g1_i1.p1  ORF type:complete len:1305 (+),score=383.43 TRINITY_DN2274_c0_g1_i1:1367-5281(+)